MKNSLNLIIGLCLLSSSPAKAISIQSDHWQCTAFDKVNNQWIADENYEKTAASKAVDACKKISPFPASCTVSTRKCTFISLGTSNHPLWQCMALDQMAKTWMSRVYTTRDEAALDAKAYCKETSGFPDTCYINLLTCENLKND